MTVEEVRGNAEGGDRNYDNFPVGMRVLAVDDNPICLKLLEGLLRKCQYHVTTTSQARVALKMLRDNRDRFDLVISDVHMPDMDGFKLLELVGLEMDLPVIMLSANSDPKLVMKGVTHGACDYLVKPVRVEELRNIWQHVIRRKKFDSNKQSKSGYEDKTLQGNEEGCQGPQQTGNADQSGKLNKKRKDEEDEKEDNEHEHEDPATQKKPRVVWSIELHRKFVTAVNHLGIEKAVPKRILDLMNVEGLTRENVASHLQKYRLYLKRISSVQAQQANMVAALGGKDAAYMRMSTLDGLGDFRTLTGSGRLSSPAFSSYTQGNMLGRLNSPAGINLHNLSSSTLVQQSHAQNLNNSISTLGKLHPALSPASQTASVFQGVPSSSEINQLQQNKCATHVGDFNPIDDSRIFGAVSAFTDTRALAINSNNNLTGAPNNSMMLQGNSQQVLAGGGFVDQSSASLASFPSESFTRDVGGSSKFLDHGRNNENWQSAVQLSKFPSNALAPSESFIQGHLSLSNVRDSGSSAGPQLQNNALGFSSATTTSALLEGSRGEIQCQEGLVGGSDQSMSQAPGQRWGLSKQNFSHNSNNIFSTLNPQASANGVITPLSRSMGQNGISDRRMDMCLNGQSGAGTSSFLQHSDIENPMTERTRSGEDYTLEQIKSQGGFVPNSYDSLDDLMLAVKQEQNGSMFDGDMGFDAYNFGSCI